MRSIIDIVDLSTEEIKQEKEALNYEYEAKVTSFLIGHQRDSLPPWKAASIAPYEDYAPSVDPGSLPF